MDETRSTVAGPGASHPTEAEVAPPPDDDDEDVMIGPPPPPDDDDAMVGPAGATTTTTTTTTAAAAPDDEEDEVLCRYCFEGPEAGELLSPCKCKGGQKWVHLSCLRRWQRMVLVSQPTHPAFYERDPRHHECNVC
eukprot:scaffold62516_cov58-Phaeocystis_antarctica.AAC.4